MTRALALALTAATGFSGLVYEVAWQKYLATLLGSHAEATAAVLAIFLGGLAAGYALFGRITRQRCERARRRFLPLHLLRFYGGVESAIGAYALLFPALFTAGQALSLLVPRGHPGVAFGFDLALSMLLIGPPAVLMGGTIPILTLALAGDVERATRVHAWIYGLNTAGAFAGALAGGFFLIPSLGLDGSMTAMGCVNLAAGLVFLALDHRGTEVAPELSAPAAEGAVSRFAAWAAVVALAGFAAMVLQTTLNRIGALTFGASQFTFAMVAAVFVLCIALGSLGVSALRRIPVHLLVVSQWALVFLLFPLYLWLGDATYWGHALRVLFRSVGPAFYAFHAAAFTALLLVLLVPIGLSGALLPLVFHRLRGEVRDLGATAGRLYAWNTAGSLLGAVLGGYLLLIWLDLHHVFRIAMTALALAAALSTLLVAPRSRLLVGLVLLPSLLGAIWWLPAWAPDRLTAGLFRQRVELPISFLGPEAFFAKRPRNVLFHDDDPTSTVAVLGSRSDPTNRSIVVNGKSDGSLDADYPTMALAALLPSLVAPHPERCFVIGWGTGVTAGELAALDDTREVVVAEISPAVLAAAPFFDEGNLAASRSPKVQARRGDAYRTLLGEDTRYDVIASEPSNPWVGGVEMLYSREFLQAARARLAPGGVYAQWFHLYETDDEVVDLVLRTYTSVFPYVSVWFTLGPDLLLLGLDSPDRLLDVAALEARFQRPDFAEGFARVGITSFPQLLAHELIPIGTLHARELPGDVHTLRHPVLSHRAAQAFFRGMAGSLPRLLQPEQREVAERNSLFRRLVAAEPERSEEALEAAVRETCRYEKLELCATFAARWRFEHPGSERLVKTLAELREEPSHRDVLRPRILAGLVALQDGAPVSMPDGVSAKRAAGITNRFVRFYHPAAPFDPHRLYSAWRRCRGEQCPEARRRAEEVLGPLAPR